MREKGGEREGGRERGERLIYGSGSRNPHPEHPPSRPRIIIYGCIWERMNGFTHIHGKTLTKKGEVYVYTYTYIKENVFMISSSNNNDTIISLDSWTPPSVPKKHTIQKDRDINKSRN